VHKVWTVYWALASDWPSKFNNKIRIWYETTQHEKPTTWLQVNQLRNQMQDGSSHGASNSTSPPSDNTKPPGGDGASKP
jgi:hypothetical protein